MTVAKGVRPTADQPSRAHVERVSIRREGSEYSIHLHVLGAAQVVRVEKTRGGTRTWRRLDRAVKFAEDRWPDVSPYFLHLGTQPPSA
jgi:hypothetical protein